MASKITYPVVELRERFGIRIGDERSNNILRRTAGGGTSGRGAGQIYRAGTILPAGERRGEVGVPESLENLHDILCPAVSPVI